MRAFSKRRASHALWLRRALRTHCVAKAPFFWRTRDQCEALRVQVWKMKVRKIAAWYLASLRALRFADRGAHGERGRMWQCAPRRARKVAAQRGVWLRSVA